MPNRREIIGIQLLKRKISIKQINQSKYLVHSQSDPDKYYEILWHRNHWVCSCKDFSKNNKKCKHIYAIDYYLTLNKITSLSENQSTIPKCPICNSNQKVIKRGIRYNRTGPEQRYYCKKDKHRFVDKTAFKSMKTKSKVIASALDLYFRNLSLRQIQEHLEDAYEINVTHTTIHNWIKKYVEIVNRFTEKAPIQTSERWHADETIIRVKGRHMVLWNLLDSRTRYLISEQISLRRDTQNARRLIHNGLQRAGAQPKEFVTDGLESYSKALEEEFDDPEGKVRIVHLQGPLSEALNNKIERYHGTFKARLKTAKHLGNKSTAETFVKGFVTHYNFVKRHKSLSWKTPAQAAKSSKQKNTWLELIEKASNRQIMHDKNT